MAQKHPPLCRARYNNEVRAEVPSEAQYMAEEDGGSGVPDRRDGAAEQWSKISNKVDKLLTPLRFAQALPPEPELVPGCLVSLRKELVRRFGRDTALQMLQGLIKPLRRSPGRPNGSTRYAAEDASRLEVLTEAVARGGKRVLGRTLSRLAREAVAGMGLSGIEAQKQEKRIRDRIAKQYEKQQQRMLREDQKDEAVLAKALSALGELNAVNWADLRKKP